LHQKTHINIKRVYIPTGCLMQSTAFNRGTFEVMLLQWRMAKWKRRWKMHDREWRKALCLVK